MSGVRPGTYFRLAQLLGVATAGLYLGATVVSLANATWAGVEPVAWIGFGLFLAAVLAMIAGLRRAYRTRFEHPTPSPPVEVAPGVSMEMYDPRQPGPAPAWVTWYEQQLGAAEETPE